MEIHRIKPEDKSNKKHTFRRSLWLLVVCATVCEGVPQEHQQVSVQENLSLQDSVSVNVVKAGDALVKAGEEVSFTATLDKALSFNGGGLQYTIVGPGGAGINSGVALSPGQLKCTVTYRVPASAPGGTWTATFTGIFDGLQVRRFPKPESITFQVIPNPDLVFPTSVSITVNQSQQQLLRRAARNLQLRIQDLKAAVASYQQANQQGRITGVLRVNVDEALAALTATETDFKKLSTANDQDHLADAFFGDLRLNYEDAQAGLDKRSARVGGAGGLMQVGFSGRQPTTGKYPILAQATLRAFESNQ